MKYLLGLDQGSTKTHAVVARRDGTILSLGEACGGCHSITGMEQALSAQRQAATQAAEKAGVSLRDIDCIGGGISGIDFPYEHALVGNAIGEAFGVSTIYVHNDCVGALWGGVFEGPAVACCAGTGLNVSGVDGRGRTIQLGNYCDGPHQGGGALGRLGLRAVFNAHIGKRPPTMLTEMLLAHFDMPDVDALLQKEHRARDIRHSQLSPLVFASAGKGDEVAVDIIRWLATHFAEYTICALRMLGMRPDDPVPVIATGSVFKGKPALMQQFMGEVLSRQWPGATLVDARYEPVVGGAVMALQQVGLGDWQANVRESARALGLERM